MRSLNSQIQRLRNHLGSRADMIAAIALAVLAVGGLSFTLTTHTGTPAGAAIAYMAAVDRADTPYVWSHSIVDVLNGSAPKATFLDRAALNAQLNATAHSRSAIGVQSASYVPGGTRVVVTYNTSSGPAKTSLIMRGGAPHSWPVLVNPAGLDIPLPAGAGAIAIDGRTLETNGNELKANNRDETSHGKMMMLSVSPTAKVHGVPLSRRPSFASGEEHKAVMNLRQIGEAG